jgi:thiol-disulfide isomerase/thioredoxin
MNRQWLAVAAIVAILLGLVGGGWLVKDRFLPVEVNTAAPDFRATDLRGQPVAFDDLSGEVVLLNIWATWCPPCREEMPSMERLHQQLGPEGLRVVAVSIDAGAGRFDASGRPGGDVAAFAEEMGLGFDIWLDPAGRIQQTYRTTGVPESFVVNRDGVIVTKVIGPTNWDAPDKIELFRLLLAQ